MPFSRGKLNRVPGSTRSGKSLTLRSSLDEKWKNAKYSVSGENEQNLATKLVTGFVAGVSELFPNDWDAKKGRRVTDAENVLWRRGDIQRKHAENPENYSTKPSAIISRNGFKIPNDMSNNNNRNPSYGGSQSSRGRRRGRYPNRSNAHDRKGNPIFTQPQNNPVVTTSTMVTSTRPTRAPGSDLVRSKKKGRPVKNLGGMKHPKSVASRSAFGALSNSGFKSMFAPNATGSKASGMSFRFVKPTVAGGVRMICKVFLNSVIIKTTTGATNWIAGTGDCAGQYYFNPISKFYVGATNGLQGIAQYFDKYRVNEARFIYNSEYMGGNTTNYQITWCACDSIDHWERMGLAGAQATPSKQQILTMSNSETFSAWTTLNVLKVPCSRRILFGASPDGISSGYSYASDSIAAARESYAFTAGLAITGPTPGSDLTLGDISLEVDIELYDMTAALTTGVNLSAKSKREKKTLTDRIAKLEAALDVDDSKSRSDRETFIDSDYIRPISNKSSSNKSTLSKRGSED